MPEKVNPHLVRRLDRYNNAGFDRGRSRLNEALWIAVSGLLVNSALPGSWHRVLVLRAFGAIIGRGVVIKPHVRIKFPWRLKIGDYSWIGEQVWIDNLAQVTIGAHSVVSQGVYLCTGSHNWRKETFDLIVKPVAIGDCAWICAMARIAPGVTVGDDAIVGFGVTAHRDVEPSSMLR